jgi:hypothetical protein
MKAKHNYGGLVGVVPMAGSRLQETVTISGSESLLQRADELYQAGNEQEARAAVREALQIAMRRLDANHGAGRDSSRDLHEVLWKGGELPT